MVHLYHPFQFHDNYAFAMEAPKSPWRYPHLFLAGKSPKFGKFRKQGSLEPETTSPRGQRERRSPFLSPSSAQRQAEVQHHEAPGLAAPRSQQPPHRQTLRRTESTSTCSSAESASTPAARRRQQKQHQTHRRRRTLSAGEAIESAGTVAIVVDHDDSSGDDNGGRPSIDSCVGDECTVSGSRGITNADLRF